MSECEARWRLWNTVRRCETTCEGTGPSEREDMGQGVRVWTRVQGTIRLAGGLHFPRTRKYRTASLPRTREIRHRRKRARGNWACGKEAGVLQGKYAGLGYATEFSTLCGVLITRRSGKNNKDAHPSRGPLVAEITKVLWTSLACTDHPRGTRRYIHQLLETQQKPGAQGDGWRFYDPHVPCVCGSRKIENARSVTTPRHHTEHITHPQTVHNVGP
ncbi:hypothetical protein Pcinc_036448 [Petrolisthes cinctipes]|uniref:Uncharacterized protein n=1 Tax=Petrolisthes cinctipes TaxID=88211 RepID=A0AAE1BUC4_PETCI|nr:hypothetical protein Pcinc_036448 [Petrolisthes cinctipes]